MAATVGAIVLYTLTADDADAVNRRRGYADLKKNHSMDPGFTVVATGEQVHIGNEAHEGDVLPMLVVAEHGSGYVNGQVFLDGTDTLWVTSVRSGRKAGSYRLPD